MINYLWNENDVAVKLLKLRKREERGVALILTIFGLLLLTAVAAAMLFSSDSETMISMNYRDPITVARCFTSSIRTPTTPKRQPASPRGWQPLMVNPIRISTKSCVKKTC